MPDPRLALLAVIVALPAPGCCTLARLFCGPDDSEWVQIDRKTPRAGLKTFMEAVRRDDCRVIYDSLGEELKRRQEIALMEACAAWERLKEEQSGLHLLGTAAVTELYSSTGRAAYQLEVAGYRFRVDLVRQIKWAVFTDLEHAPEISDWEATMSERMTWPVEDGENLVLILPDPVERVPLLTPENIMGIFMGPQWKVDRFEPIEDVS